MDDIRGPNTGLDEDSESKNSDKSLFQTYVNKNYSKFNCNALYKQKNLASQKPATARYNLNTIHSLPLTDSSFVGRRDVSDPKTLQETRITSAKGTVRGYKNRVRAGIVTFLKEQEGKEWNYHKSEKGKIVVYMTSMRVVRSTHERCSIVQKILQTHLVRYEEKDLFMSRDNQKELSERLGKSEVTLPQVFVDGLNLGSAETLEFLNETGELREIFKNFEKINVKSFCVKCGGYRYVPCSVCHGSKRSMHRNNFTEEFAELRCVYCDENGLLRCDYCLDQQE